MFFFLTYIKKRVTMERIAIIKYYIVAFSCKSTFKSIRKEEQARRGRKIDPWPMN